MTSASKKPFVPPRTASSLSSSLVLSQEGMALNSPSDDENVIEVTEVEEEKYRSTKRQKKEVACSLLSQQQQRQPHFNRNHDNEDDNDNDNITPSLLSTLTTSSPYLKNGASKVIGKPQRDWREE